MRSKKLVAVLMGTALLGVTCLGGFAAAETSSAEKSVAENSVSKPQVPNAGAAEAQAREAQAPEARVAEARARALGELRVLVEKGVPGADPKTDARLKQALVTAEKALASVRTHETAQAYTHSWTLTVKPGVETRPAPRVDVPPLPDLDALLEAVKSLDLAKVLESLTTLLDGVLSTLTSSVSGITDSLSSTLPDTSKAELPDMPEIQIPEIQMPDIQLPAMPQMKFPSFAFPDIKMPAIRQHSAFRPMPGFTAGR